MTNSIYIGAVAAVILLVIVAFSLQRQSRRRRNRPLMVSGSVPIIRPHQQNHALYGRANQHTASENWVPHPQYNPPNQAYSVNGHTNPVQPIFHTRYNSGPTFPSPLSSPHDIILSPSHTSHSPRPPFPLAPNPPPQTVPSVQVPSNESMNLVERMQLVQGLMVEIHRLENEIGTDNRVRIQELHARITELSDVAASGVNASSGRDVVVEPPPAYVRNI
ncbi:hypothetical protein B0H34DRAFT_340503 [Crassisporium funariophilum]|nr:hypothetical protein B0H34DRAFT_340503 [Crassisporium funariophilum]